MGTELDAVFAGEVRPARCALRSNGSSLPVDSPAWLLGIRGGWFPDGVWPVGLLGGKTAPRRMIHRPPQATSAPIGWGGTNRSETGLVIIEEPVAGFTVAFTLADVGRPASAVVDIDGPGPLHAYPGKWSEPDPDHVVIEAGPYRVDLQVLPWMRPK